MDSSRNQEEPDININKKDNLTLGLFTLKKTLKLISRAFLLLPVESLSSLVKKKLYYKIVFTKEIKPKKKINRNIEE